MTKKEKENNECVSAEVVCEYPECNKNNDEQGIELFYTNDNEEKYHIVCEQHFDALAQTV